MHGSKVAGDNLNMSEVNMVRIGYAQNNSFRQRPQMYAATSVSDLSYRENEIVNKIRDKLAPLGSSLKFDVGHNSVSVTMFIGNKTDSPRPFVLNRQLLAEMADDENKYREWMSKIQDMITQQSSNKFGQNGQGEIENYLSQRDAERASHQARVHMMSALDFWNEHSNEGQSWVQLGQGQAIQQKIAQFKQSLT